MYVYANKNIKGNYAIFDKKLDKNLYNNIGTTYAHYQSGWWVELNDVQLRIHEEYPNASVQEVLEMKLKDKPVVDKFAEAKNNKLREIQAYDQSKEVNGFVVNNIITTWLTVQERLNYKQSVEAAKLLGEETLDFLIEGMPFNISIEQAEYMLAMIQRYADKCFIVTEQHKANVNAMTLVEQIESYDHKEGYPEMLKFELPCEED